MKVVNVDLGEPQSVISSLRRELEGKGFSVKVRRNPVSDIYLGNLVGIERKTGHDFIASIVDGRLLEQVKNLNKNFQHAYIIVEGNINDMMDSFENVPINTVIGAVCCCMARYSIPVIFAGNYLPRIVNYLFKIHTDEKTVELERFIPSRFDKDYSLAIISAFPGVDRLLAKRLVKKFGSVKEVVNASVNDVDDLTEVKGIGIKKAKKIKKSLLG